DRQVITDTLQGFVLGNWQMAPNYPTVTQVHNYRWVRHNGPNAFLLQIDADSLGTTATRSEYQFFSIISVPEISGETQQIKPYPNPSHDVIHIDFGTEAAAGTIRIYNTIGALVISSDFNNVNQYVMHVNKFE